MVHPDPVERRQECCEPDNSSTETHRSPGNCSKAQICSTSSRGQCQHPWSSSSQQDQPSPQRVTQQNPWSPPPRQGPPGLPDHFLPLYLYLERRFVSNSLRRYRPQLPGSSVHGTLQQEYWSRRPCLSPGHLPDPGTGPMSLTSPALADGFFMTSAT